MIASMTGVRSATVDGSAGAGPAPDPAYGVFDTMLVRAGRAVDLETHVGRVARSVRELYDVPIDAGALAARIVADASGLETARVRTSYDPVAREWEIEATRIEEPGLDPRTLAVRRVPRGLGAHKWSDRRLVADPGEADDVLLVDDAGLVLECGSANVFVVFGDDVVTPPLDGRILPGIVRVGALERLRNGPVSVTERDLDVGELSGATEVFTTSSVRGIQPVAAVRGVGAWPLGPVTKSLRDP
jgi:para-aminobenzoate synthetase/4-amino-4-deoxychorismate lyase